MSMQDPIADLLTQIRNSQQAKKTKITLPSSNLKFAIAKVLKEEGYIENVDVKEIDGKKQLEICLKYYSGSPVINTLKRISKPSLRVYKSYKKLAKVSGFGVAILSTSKGIMTDRQAKAIKIGGEVVCQVN